MTDTDRLNWLEKNEVETMFSARSGYSLDVLQSRGDFVWYWTIREAIDAAMEEGDG